MKIKLFNIIIIIILCIININSAYSQTKYRITTAVGLCVPINELLDSMPDKNAQQVLNKYYYSIHIHTDSIIGYSADIMSKHGQQSLLGNFTTDALITIAEQIFDSIQIDMGLINKGGMRKNLLQGDITTGNIYDIFPFEDNISVISVKGSVIREMFETFVRNNDYEAFSGAQLIVKDNKIESISVNEQQLNDNKIYNIATLDFIADGKDHLEMLKNTVMRIDSNVSEGIAFINYIKQITARGDIVTSKLDGRLIIK